jgi:hypothetical protein
VGFSRRGRARHRLGLWVLQGREDVFQFGQRICGGAGFDVFPFDRSDGVFERTLLPLGDPRRRRRVERGDLAGDSRPRLVIDAGAQRRIRIAEPIQRLPENRYEICHLFADLYRAPDAICSAQIRLSGRTHN